MKRVATYAIFVMALSLIITPAIFSKGSHDKANGGVCTAEKGWCISFTAHRLEGVVARGNVQLANDLLEQHIHCKVKFARIRTHNAWIAAQVLYDSTGKRVGDWFYFQVRDRGTPATDGDYIAWDWDTKNAANAKRRVIDRNPAANVKTIISGNLKIILAKKK